MGMKVDVYVDMTGYLDVDVDMNVNVDMGVADDVVCGVV